MNESELRETKKKIIQPFCSSFINFEFLFSFRTSVDWWTLLALFRCVTFMIRFIASVRFLLHSFALIQALIVVYLKAKRYSFNSFHLLIFLLLYFFFVSFFLLCLKFIFCKKKNTLSGIIQL